jgi:hypothetical protein
MKKKKKRAKLELAHRLGGRCAKTFETNNTNFQPHQKASEGSPPFKLS